MLERVSRKVNPFTLLLGMYIDTATMEDGVEVLKKLKIEILYDPTVPLRKKP